MEDNPFTHGHSRHPSAAILGKRTFEKLRTQAAARLQAKTARKLSIERRLVMRVLNKDLGKPHLRVIK